MSKQTEVVAIYVMDGNNYHEEYFDFELVVNNVPTSLAYLNTQVVKATNKRSFIDAYIPTDKITGIAFREIEDA